MDEKSRTGGFDQRFLKRFKRFHQLIALDTRIRGDE